MHRKSKPPLSSVPSLLPSSLRPLPPNSLFPRVCQEKCYNSESQKSKHEKSASCVCIHQSRTTSPTYTPHRTAKRPFFSATEELLDELLLCSKPHQAVRTQTHARQTSRPKEQSERGDVASVQERVFHDRIAVEFSLIFAELSAEVLLPPDTHTHTHKGRTDRLADRVDTGTWHSTGIAPRSEWGRSILRAGMEGWLSFLFLCQRRSLAGRTRVLWEKIT